MVTVIISARYATVLELQWHAQINILINRMMIFYYVRKVPSIHNFHFLRRFFRNRLTSVCAEDIVLTCLF